MARSLWTGTLSFGLVNVPVRLETGVRDRDLHFRQLHESDGAPLEVLRMCEQEDVEVPYEEITHLYEGEDGQQVLVSDLELEAIEPKRTRTIDIEAFVELAEVDPIFFDHPYYLVPAGEDDGTLRAYRLLSEVMGRSERAALGRFVIRAKEYLTLVRSREGVLSLTTMTFADEIRSADEVDGAQQKSHKPTAKQLDRAVAVIEELSADWDPERYRDRYRQRLQRTVARKRKGETITVPDAAQAPEPAPDLMEALERTLAELSADSERSSDGSPRSGGSSRKRQPQQAQ